MKAVYIKEFGGAENLEIREVKNPPAPQGAEVLVRVRAAGLNRADILQRRGFYPAPKGFPERVLGLEFAGEVAEIGEAVKDFQIGDRVFGITAGGAQAEFVLSDENQIACIPINLNFIQAAAVPEAFITAHDALFTQADLKESETVLIHAVASGVGLAALQLAKAKDAQVFGTSRSGEKLVRCEKFGLDCGIVTDADAMDNNTHLFAELIQAKNDGKGVDVILDLVGAKYFEANLASLAPKGRLILIGLVGGAQAEFNLGIALSKRLKIIGTVLRSRSAAEKVEATRKFAEEVLPLLESSAVVPNVDKVFRLENVQEAHEYLETNESFGKVVLDFG